MSPSLNSFAKNHESARSFSQETGKKCGVMLFITSWLKVISVRSDGTDSNFKLKSNKLGCEKKSAKIAI